MWKGIGLIKLSFHQKHITWTQLWNRLCRPLTPFSKRAWTMDGSMVASLSICGTKGSIRSEHIFAAEIWIEIAAIICILIHPIWFFSSFNCLIAWSIISANSLSWSQSLMLISSVAICYGTIQFLCKIQTTWCLFYSVVFEKPNNLYEEKLI